MNLKYIKKGMILIFFRTINLFGRPASYDDYSDPEETRFFWEQPLGIIAIIIGIIYYINKSK